MVLETKYIQVFHPEALSIYNAFKKKKGSEHISSPVGIHVLLQILAGVKPKNILEVGGGIGALSYTALSHSNAYVDIFEDNPFCIGELKKNLETFKGRFTLLTDYNNYLLPHNDYDLLIIDGGGHAFVYNLISQCHDIGRVFVEGGRAEQRKQARRALRARYLFRPIQYLHLDRKYKGAHQIICRRSNNIILRHLSYWFWEIIIFTEIKSALKNRMRKLLHLKSDN